MNTRYWIAIFLICTSTLLWSQDIDRYQKQRKLLQEHINLLDQNLNQTELKKSELDQQYLILQKKIDKRIALQSSLNNEIKAIDHQIDSLQSLLANYQQQKLTNEAELHELLRWKYYRKKSTHPLQYLLSAESLKEAILKWRYMNQLQSYIVSHINNIDTLQARLDSQIQNLKSWQEEKAQLLHEEETNVYALKQEKEISSRLRKELGSETSRIKSELARQQAEQLRINQVIQALVQKEAAQQKANNNHYKPSTSSDSKSFATRRRRLIWPVKSGVITRHFGVQPHPTVKNIKVQNLGIDMLCPAGSVVANVHDGKVLLISYQPDYQNIVIINHGTYSTAYYHLEKVLVKKGAQVNTGQIIGHLADSSQGNSPFHFEIWYRQKQLNPEDWLRKR